LDQVGNVMNKNISKSIARKINLLAYYQLAGGVVGMLMILWALTQIGSITGLVLAILIIVALLYSFSIFCGRKLLSGEIDLGLKLSKLIQVVQIFSFALLGYAFKFIAGFGVLIGFDFTDSFNFRFAFNTSDFQINYNSDDEVVSLMVNILAIYLIQFISELQEDIKEYRLIHAANLENTGLIE